jgi:hypothetical protein
MHDDRPLAAEVLPELVESVRRAGLQLTTIPKGAP